MIVSLSSHRGKVKKALGLTSKKVGDSLSESQLIRLYPQRAASFDYTLRQDVHLADIDIT